MHCLTEEDDSDVDEDSDHSLEKSFWSPQFIHDDVAQRKVGRTVSPDSRGLKLAKGEVISIQ